MAKARQQQTRTRREKAFDRTQKPRAQPGKPASARWAPWAVPLVVATLVLISLVAWRVIPAITGAEANNSGAVNAISTLDSPDFHSLLVDPQDAGHLLFGSHVGIQESRDGGQSWENGALRNVDAMQLAASPNAPETIYATGHDVFEVSHDVGQSWQRLTPNLPGTDIHGFAQDPEDPDRLYAFVVGSGIFTSADGGVRWDQLSTQPPGGDMHVALAAGSRSLYAATETGLVVTRDGGESWEALGAQPSGPIISLAINASNPQILYAGTPSGLAKSTDGGASWTDLGPQGVPILAIAVTPSNPSQIFLLSDEGAVYRSLDGGITWR